MEKDILNVQEISEYLSIDSDTVMGWLNMGKMSGFKVNNAWRARRGEVEKFIDQLIQTQELETLQTYITNPENWAKQILQDFPDMSKDLLENKQTPGSMGDWLRVALQKLQKKNESQ